MVFFRLKIFLFINTGRRHTLVARARVIRIMYILYWHTSVVFTLAENQEKKNEIIVFLDKPPSDVCVCVCLEFLKNSCVCVCDRPFDAYINIVCRCGVYADNRARARTCVWSFRLGQR